eukprot:693256-Prorocentrum_minimum.AAC.14
MRRSTNRPLLGQYQATQPIPIPKNKLQQNPNPNPTNPRASESFALEPTPTSTPKINADDRKLRLTAALDARGLAFREDSVLCNDYVMKGRGCVSCITYRPWLEDSNAFGGVKYTSATCIGIARVARLRM